MDAKHDEHYLRDVTALGDSRQMVAHRPIYTQNRIKLVDVGGRINSALFEKLVRHKLLPDIDQCVTVENEVTTDLLVAEAKRLIRERPFLAHLVDAAGGEDRLLGPLGQMTLEPPLAMKLTVMQERRPQLFEHSIEVAVIALYLGCASFPAEGNMLRNLAAAGLLHDIGAMHIDPDILDPAHEVSEDERRHIYAHPLTAFLILNEYPAYVPQVSTAVLEHHEREDGHGYPRGIKGAESSALGRIVAFAEVVAGLIRKLPAGGDFLRIGVAIKLGSHKYDSALVSHMCDAFRGLRRVIVGKDTERFFLAKIEKLGSLIGNWQATYEGLAEHCNGGMLANFVDRRVTELEHILSEAGCHPDQLSLVYHSSEGDAAALAEMAGLADEGLWQIRDIAHAARRRWDSFDSGEEERQLVLRWLDNCDQLFEERPTDQ